MKRKNDLKLIIGYSSIILFILMTFSMLNLLIIQQPIMNKSWNMTIAVWNSTDTIAFVTAPSGIPITNITSLIYLSGTLIIYVSCRGEIAQAIKDMKKRIKGCFR